MTSLLDILVKRIKPKDVITEERMMLLNAKLSELNKKQGETVYSVIMSYKKLRDSVRVVGDDENDVPYYGEDTPAGIKMSLKSMPEELVLILEILVNEA